MAVILGENARGISIEQMNDKAQAEFKDVKNRQKDKEEKQV